MRTESGFYPEPIKAYRPAKFVLDATAMDEIYSTAQMASYETRIAFIFTGHLLISALGMLVVTFMTDFVAQNKNGGIAPHELRHSSSELWVNAGASEVGRDR